MNNDPTESDAKQAFADVVRKVLDGARAAGIAIQRNRERQRWR